MSWKALLKRIERELEITKEDEIKNGSVPTISTIGKDDQPSDHDEKKDQKLRLSLSDPGPTEHDKPVRHLSPPESPKSRRFKGKYLSMMIKGKFQARPTKRKVKSHEHLSVVRKKIEIGLLSHF